MSNDLKEKLKLFASLLLPLSLFSMAAALAYFTYELSAVSRQIPEILESIDSTSENIQPVLDEVGNILDLVPPILKEVEEVRKLIPPILEEVEQTRKQIPPILSEVEQTRNQIPAILDESKAIRGDVPAVLASADKASEAVAGVARQVEASRPLVKDVLQEVATTREAIPPMMDRADVLVEKARVAGKEASEGAVTGLFTGIIRAPFALVASAGQGIAGLTEEEAKYFNDKDYSLVQQASLYLLNNGSKGDRRKWHNDDSGNHGEVQLSRIYTEGDYSEIDCRSLNISLYNKDELIKEGTRAFCKNDKGEWDFEE